MKRLLYFVSGHGFGHAVRSALVVGELHRLGIHCTVITAAPKYVFDANLKGVGFDYLFMKSDAGVCQNTSLDMDLAATYAGWMEVFENEGAWMEKMMELAGRIKPAAVVSDIVPAAFLLAKRASLPSFLITSFTWDWITGYYRADDPRFAPVSDRLREQYMMAGAMIYSPLSFSLPPVEPKHYVSLIGKRSALTRRELRKKLGLDDRETFLVSFGGLGIKGVEKMGLREMNRYRFLFLAADASREENLITFSGRDVGHEELVAVSDALITKPGYGMCSEAILNRTVMIYTSRQKFAEYQPLAAEMKKYIPTRFISNEELFSGGLKEKLENLPPFNDSLLTDPGNGAAQAARQIAQSI